MAYTYDWDDSRKDKERGSVSNSEDECGEHVVTNPYVIADMYHNETRIFENKRFKK